ncbi:MMPL family transporter [Pseudoalteromonas xiamenensis]|nr:MMPL family transporter [Pseudoalteromonas xiamenensis]WMN60282.1 MMPL family transporter [Pseudoalteromonas xiamenensis]
MIPTWLKPIINAPKTTIVLSLLLLFAAALGSGKLYFRGDYRVFFDSDNEQMTQFETIERTFNKSDNISIVVSANGQSVFTAETLRVIEELTQSAWKTPYSSRVDSIANFQHTTADSDDLVVEDLITSESLLTAENIADIRNVALNEPQTRRSLVSTDETVAIVNITVQLPDIDKTDKVIAIKQFTQKLVEEYQTNYPNLTFYQSGQVAMNYAFIDASQSDFSTLVPSMLLVIMVFLGLLLRSFAAVVYTLIVIIGAVVATLGIAGWLGMFLSTATVNVPTMVLTIAVADCVHILAAIRHHMRTGANKSDAIRLSLQSNWLPVIITSVTTALGFLVMNSLDVPIIRDLGNLSALGVMLACVLSLTLLPALVHVLPFKPSMKSNSTGSLRFSQFADWLIAKKVLLTATSVILVIAAAVAVGQNRINDEAVKYFAQGTEFRDATDFMEQHLSGMTTVSIALDSGQSDGISAPDFLQTLEHLTTWLRSKEQVHHVTSLADTFKRLNMNLHGDDIHAYTLPNDRELAAQYLLMYEMSLPYGLDLNNQVNIDKSAVKLQLTLANQGSKELVAIEAEIRTWLNLNAANYQAQISSPSLMFAHIGEINMKSMLQSLPMALLLISGLLVFSLRSLRLGLISLVPNLVPAILGFGLWGLYSGEINLGLSVVVTLTLGIVVDDTVHFLSKYQYAKQQGLSTEGAIRYAFTTVGRALLITTCVLVAGFTMLGTSAFRLNSDMGQLSALVIFIALIVDFILLPCMLLWFDNSGSDEVVESNEVITTNEPQLISKY